jgi:hypothetical protein
MEEKISSSERGKSRIVDFAQRVVSSKTFDWIITGVILLQAFALAIEATPALLEELEKGINKSSEAEKLSDST